jgi:4-diphosphocytidyl-2-C-methyl-D-erythritol kinase
VLSKRADGYHEIETLMVPVSLYDELHFSTNDFLTNEAGYATTEHATTERATNASAVAFSGRWASDVWRGDQDAAEKDRSNEHPIPQGAENLVVKAVELLRRRAGTDAGATIRLVKRIPMAAGLGGGSSDAAAALVAANLAWRLHYSARELMPLAAEVGSDVPFFLTRMAAICRGRGERVEPLESRAVCHFVIVQPPEGLATAEVYRQCRPAASPRTSSSIVEALRRGDVPAAGQGLRNALQPPAERLSPWIGRMKQHFAQLGFAGHQMSGSGTSYFGLSPTAGHARRAAARLRGLGWSNVYTVRGCL